MPPRNQRQAARNQEAGEASASLIDQASSNTVSGQDGDTPAQAEDALLQQQIAEAERERQTLQYRMRLQELQAQIEALRNAAPTEGAHPAGVVLSPGVTPASSKELRIDKLPIFYGRTVQEHNIWVTLAKQAFLAAPSLFELDTNKIIFANQFLDKDNTAAWVNYQEAEGITNISWKQFENFLLDRIEDPANRALSSYIAYTKAEQRPNQPVSKFDAYLSSLESQIGEMAEDTRAMLFYAKLQPELRNAIARSGQELPKTRRRMVNIAIRFDLARVTKRSVDTPEQRDYKRARTSEYTRPKQPNRNPHAGSQLPIRQKGSNTCNRCRKEGHWARDCYSITDADGKHIDSPAPAKPPPANRNGMKRTGANAAEVITSRKN